jgi:hypothetical protein
LWLIALLVLFGLFTSQLRNFRNESSVVVNNNVPCDTCQVLYLELAEDTYKGYAAHSWDLNHLKVMQIRSEKIMLGTPQLDIEKAGGDEFVVVIKKNFKRP